MVGDASQYCYYLNFVFIISNCHSFCRYSENNRSSHISFSVRRTAAFLILCQHEVCRNTNFLPLYSPTFACFEKFSKSL